MSRQGWFYTATVALAACFGLLALGAQQLLAARGSGCHDGAAVSDSVVCFLNDCINLSDHCVRYRSSEPGGVERTTCVCDPTPAGHESDYSGDEYSETLGSLCIFYQDKSVVGGTAVYTYGCFTLDCANPCEPDDNLNPEDPPLLEERWCDCP